MLQCEKLPVYNACHFLSLLQCQSVFRKHEIMTSASCNDMLARLQIKPT